MWTNKNDLLGHLMQDSAYEECLEEVVRLRNLRKEDVNACTCNLYHQLSKYTHGNTDELVLHYTETEKEAEPAITEVAAMEAVFCALKKKGCFRLTLKVVGPNNERIV